MGNIITITPAKLQAFNLSENRENKDKIGLFVEFLSKCTGGHPSNFRKQT